MSEWMRFRYASASDAVLLRNAGYKLALTKSEDIRKAYFDIGEHDWIDYQGEIVEEVTHWMDLPEPPK